MKINPSNMELAELREVVSRARKNALKKRRRLQSPGDDYIQIEGTKYDPIRPPNVHNKYNRKQLLFYLSKLEEFNSRKTKFVPGARHIPIPSHKWEAYKKIETSYNEKVEQFAYKFDSVVKPGVGYYPPSTTFKISHPDHMAGNSPINGSKRKYKRKSTQIMGEDKLNRLSRNLMKAFDDKAMRKEMGTNYLTVRDILYRYADDVGDNLVELFESLTAEQFEYFWYFAPQEVNEFFLWYESIKVLDSDKEEAHPIYESLYDSSRKNVANFFKDVKNKVKGGKPARVNKWGYMQPSVVRIKQRGGKFTNKRIVDNE